jgi:hypothetical protein
MPSSQTVHKNQAMNVFARMQQIFSISEFATDN